MEFKDIEIKWLGHAGFLIKNQDILIYIDPFQISDNLQEEKADIILITHSHYDHCSIEDLKKIAKNETIVICPGDCFSKFNHLKEKIDLKIIEIGKEIDIKDIKIKAIPSYNINKQFHPKEEEWIGYLINLNNIKIYHTGDTDLIPEINNLEKENIDIALLPIGGTYTMDVEDAVQAVEKIKPKIAIPMHYGNVVGSEEDALKFKELCEAKEFNVNLLEKA